MSVLSSFIAAILTNNRAQRYVALKILRADCYNGSHNIYEREILSKLSDSALKTDHSGRDYVLPVLDQFEHNGPNGQHVCLVFEVLGHHLTFQTSKFEDGRLPVKTVRSITRQLLLGLDFLHRDCGIIHTGTYMTMDLKNAKYAEKDNSIDLKPTNILLELENPQENVSTYISETPPRMIEKDGGYVPAREVIRTPLITEMREPHIRIIDFGVGRCSYC